MDGERERGGTTEKGGTMADRLSCDPDCRPLSVKLLVPPCSLAARLAAEGAEAQAGQGAGQRGGQEPLSLVWERTRVCQTAASPLKQSGGQGAGLSDRTGLQGRMASRARRCEVVEEEKRQAETSTARGETEARGGRALHTRELATRSQCTVVTGERRRDEWAERSAQRRGRRGERVWKRNGGGSLAARLPALDCSRLGASFAGSKSPPGVLVGVRGERGREDEGARVWGASAAGEGDTGFGRFVGGGIRRAQRPTRVSACGTASARREEGERRWCRLRRSCPCRRPSTFPSTPDVPCDDAGRPSRF